jgi:ribonuclease HI
VPFWELSKPSVNLDLSKDKKSDTHSLEFIQKFRELKQEFSTHNEIYTDGSKDQNNVASAAVCGNVIFSARLPNNSSIFTAEAKALQLAFDFIKHSDDKKHIIYSDSISCLQAIKNCKTDHPFISNILKEYVSLKLRGHIIVFCWIPSHIGIHGNTKADSAAKQALQLPITDIPYTDLKASIREYVKHLYGKLIGTKI